MSMPPQTESPLLWVARKLKGLPSKRSQVLLQIHGEAGIGKTRAVTELLKNSPCAGLTQRAITPLGQVIAALPRPKRLSDWLQRKLEQADSSVETLLALLESNAPFVLHIEDVHEATEAQQTLWQQLAQTASRSKGIGLIFTSRVPLEMPVESLRLEPLSISASTALLEAEVGVALPAEATTWIYNRAAGNPLFTLEFFKHLVRQGLLWNDTKYWHWREPPADIMPITVEALIEQLHFTSADTVEHQMIINARAFLETRVPQLQIELALWGNVAGVTPTQLEQNKLSLQRRGILHNDSFAHPLFREIAFKQLDVPQREVLATRALQALEQHHPELAAEFLTDANLANEATFNTLMSYANALKDQPARAAQLKTRAAQLLIGEPRAKLLLEALSVFMHSEPGQALVLANSILEIPDLPDITKAEAIYHATYSIVTTTRNIASAEESLARLPKTMIGDARYVSSLLGYMMMCGQAPRALALWEAHPELQAVADTTLLIHVLSAMVQTAQFARAETLSIQTLQSATLQDREKMSIYNIRAIALAQLGQLEAAQEASLKALELAEKLEQHNAVGAMLFNRAITLDRQGQRQAMRANAERALVALEKAGNHGLASQASLILANDDLESGRYSQAETCLNTIYATLKQTTITPFLVSIELALVRFHLQQQVQYSHTLALKYARDALRHAQSLEQAKQIANAQTHLALVLLEIGQTAEVAPLIDNALAVLKEAPDASSFYGLSAEAKWLESQQQPALEAWQTVVARAEALGFTFDAKCYQLELARVTNNISQAAELRTWFLAQGLLHGAFIAERYFPALTGEKISLTSQSLRLEVLGTMQISTDGVCTIVKGQKRKELLAFLLEQRMIGRTEVKTLDLLDSLYPNHHEEEAMTSLKQSVFKTRAAHGAQIISTTSNGYALGQTSSDAEEFLQTGNTLLWRGVYLEGLSTTEEVRDILTQTAHNQTQKILETNPKEVARVMRLLLESDPFDLTTLKLVCQALRLDNNHRTLQRVYQESRAKLLEVGEVLPETWQDFLQ